MSADAARRRAPTSLTGAQLRAARGLLNMSIAELADRTGLALNTIRRAEATNGDVPITAANTQLLVTTLEEEGVVFIAKDAQGVGVRFASAQEPPFQNRRRAGNQGE